MEDYLAHYGVKGMKWGKRKKKSSYAMKLSKRNPISEVFGEEFQKKLEKRSKLMGVSGKDYIKIYTEDRVVKDPFSKTGKAIEKDYISGFKYGKNIYPERGTDRYLVDDEKTIAALEGRLTIRPRKKDKKY